MTPKKGRFLFFFLSSSRSLRTEQLMAIESFLPQRNTLGVALQVLMSEQALLSLHGQCKFESRVVSP